jgi:hypothetical protein
LDGGPLIGVFVGLLFRPDDLVLVTCSITGERVGFGDINGDDASPKELLCLHDFSEESIDGQPGTV